MFTSSKYFLWIQVLMFMLHFWGDGILSAYGEEIHCVFQHGLNPYSIPKENDPNVFYYTTETIGNLAPPLSYYWGDVVKKWTLEGNHPCTTYAFTYLDTMNKPYTEKRNSTAACNALYMDENKTKPKRTKVFLHSMGNLIFYNALAEGDCTINKEKTKVYSLAGPFGGAPIVEPLDEICAELHKEAQKPMIKSIKSGISSFFNCFPPCSIFSFIALKLNIFFKHEEKMVGVAESFCRNGKAAPGVASCHKGASPLKDEIIIAAAQRFGSGALCGYSYGTNDLYGVLEFLTARYGKKGSMRYENDGVVPLTSCAKPWMTKTYHGREADVRMRGVTMLPFNHSDLTGARGHSEITDWLINRV